MFYVLWIHYCNYTNFTQSCSIQNNTGVISSKLVNKFVHKCQCYYTLSNQSIPMVTVTSIVSLLTEQLWFHIIILWTKSIFSVQCDMGHESFSVLQLLRYILTSFARGQQASGLLEIPIPARKRIFLLKLSNPQIF